jgi:thiamine biosynthesis lipoprotein
MPHSGRPSSQRTRRRAKPLLGTLVEISVKMAGIDMDAETSRADRAIDAAFSEIATIHHLMSFHEPQSDVARINRAETGIPVAIDARTTEVLQAARRASIESCSAFDCTVAAELVALGLLPFHPVATPTSHDASRWILQDDRFIKFASCLVDLGGIAKGYAVDRAIGVLQQHDIQNALVNAGGDLRHIGTVPEIVHLRDAGDPGCLSLAIALNNQALASSAAGGLTPDGAGMQSALIDGISRTPIGLGASVSIIASTCMDADLLTKVVLASDNPHHHMMAHYGAHVAQYRGPTRNT